MDIFEAARIIGDCAYKPGWHIVFNANHTMHASFIQLEVDERAEASMDSRTYIRAPWKSAKRYLSPHMCRQEIVGIIFGLIKDAEMHETHEWFRYKGASIYNPHLDPEALVLVAKKKENFNTRVNAMTMVEDNGVA